MVLVRPTPLLLGASLPSLALLAAPTSRAFSAPAPPPDGIKIVGLPGGKIESLPGMYVQTFRRWIVDGSDDGSCDDAEGRSQATQKAEPLRGAGLAYLQDGWVDPTSTRELWWPGDLATVQARPALNVLLRNGRLSYAGAGMDVRVPRGGDDATWRNYGLHSQPIARTWTTLDIAMEGIFHVETFVLRDGEEGEHEELFPSLDVRAAFHKAATFVAEIDARSPLAEGFHIVSFPLADAWTDLPPPKNVGAAAAAGGGDDAEGTYRIVSLGTSEPFASKLLDLDEDFLTMSSTSVLEVRVSRTAPGGASEYLPEPYKELYLGS